MRWALAIGRLPRELLQSVTSADITEMQAFAELEPFGSLVDDMRIGQLCALLGNVYRDKKKRSKPFGASDYMPALAAELRRSTPPPPPMSKEQRSRAIDRLLFGGPTPRKTK